LKNVLVFIIDGFADWEASYVTAELNKPGTGFQVQTIAIDKNPKKSMGGLTVLPDYSLLDFPFVLEKKELKEWYDLFKKGFIV